MMKIRFSKKLPQSGLLKNKIKQNKTNKNMFDFVLEDLIINQIVFYLVFLKDAKHNHAGSTKFRTVNFRLKNNAQPFASIWVSRAVQTCYRRDT
jgi:hypothetical protein